MSNAKEKSMQPTRRVLTIVSALILALMVSTVPASARSEALPPENIGFVLYSKTDNPGTLIARWNFENRYYGPGMATGGPEEGFEGNYHVRYFFDDGTFSDEYKLQITASGSFYDVVWRVGGVAKAIGVGMLVDDGSALAVGWRRVE